MKPKGVKKLSQALCWKCGRVWLDVTKEIIENQVFCPDCAVLAVLRCNPN